MADKVKPWIDEFGRQIFGRKPATRIKKTVVKHTHGAVDDLLSGLFGSSKKTKKK